VFLTYFNAGLRAVDVSDPLHPKEVGCYVPETPEGTPGIQSNDIGTDRRRPALSDRPLGPGHAHPGIYGINLFAFSFPALVAELKTVRSLDEFARVLEKHTADHAFGTSIAVVATIMAAAGIMAAAILG
jgi:hypothetical protein